MTIDDVIAILRRFEQNQMDRVIDGGWGVDALLGELTRLHSDLAIAVERKDVPHIRSLLESRGYTDVPPR